jgi:hypothetical protein
LLWWEQTGEAHLDNNQAGWKTKRNGKNGKFSETERKKFTKSRNETESHRKRNDII